VNNIFFRDVQPRPELQSLVINFLRFPLIVCLVFFHASDPDTQINGIIYTTGSTDFPIHYYCSQFFCGPLQLYVEFFFFVSGFLFFNNINMLDLLNYKNKIQNRVGSLLVPYLFWNFVVFTLYFSINKIPQLESFVNKDVHFHDFISYFWNNPGEMKTNYKINPTMPISYQFWFVRDLMIAVLLTPIISLFCRKTKIYGIILIGILWYFGYWFKIPGLSIVWIFFFTAGAYFGIHKRNLIEDFGKIRNISFILFPVIAVANLMTMEYIFNEYIHKIGIIIGIVFSFNFAAYLFEKNVIKPVKYLSVATFFIFATHDPFFYRTFYKVSYMIFSPESDLGFTLLYFANSILVVFSALGLFFVLKRFLPRFTRIITGGR